MSDQMTYWTASAPPPEFPQLRQHEDADYAIVGGGIVGLTLACLLAEQGQQVVVLEGNRVLHGTTGHSTAKVTVQHDLIYSELAAHFNIENARLYYETQDAALQFMRRTAAAMPGGCEWSDEDAYLYASSASATTKLMKEFETYQQLGMPGQWLEEVPLPGLAASALKLPGQAQFHPVRYLNGLIARIVQAGGRIYEQTRIDAKLEHRGGRPLIRALHGPEITARQVIACSQYPFYDGGGFYFARMHPAHSYIMAVQPEQPFPGGMYLSVDEPKRSLRAVTIDGQPMVLVAGESHQTGQGDPASVHFANLERFATQTLGVRQIPYRWSAQDWQTLDKLPYIGPLSPGHPDVWVATGLRKWGMTGGTAAALLLRDLLLGVENRYATLVTPARFGIDPDLKALVKENADVAKHLLAGKLTFPDRDPGHLRRQEGAAVVLAGKRAGAYRDAGGQLHLVDTTCTHMGCECAWNDGARTWDCPCHGSRFDADGQVLSGPAVKPLRRLLPGGEPADATPVTFT
ncbi:FAD-dependent oxidoreductase [Paenibacillus sp. IB182496]|uniref:FAD-dependent oxidoreductase n=1 Tax=Paenibacillus sabuli TaxID=2772509 RepID=A0A927BW25_9BACL|nr:FAD-dependent oxidoreductase [Paenibacillus sabuli]MBD2846700.1 FAD-dependent oxidoreductase [Paenibacillus sabuli]